MEVLRGALIGRVARAASTPSVRQKPYQECPTARPGTPAPRLGLSTGRRPPYQTSARDLAAFSPGASATSSRKTAALTLAASVVRLALTLAPLGEPSHAEATPTAAPAPARCTRGPRAPP